MNERYIMQYRTVSTAVWESTEPREFYRDVVEALEARDRHNAGLRGDGFEAPARVVSTAGKVIEYGTETVAPRGGAWPGLGETR